MTLIVVGELHAIISTTSGFCYMILTMVEELYTPTNNLKAQARWAATGKRLSNRLLKLNLVTLSSLGTAGYGSTCHHNSRFRFLGAQGEY